MCYDADVKDLPTASELSPGKRLARLPLNGSDVSRLEQQACFVQRMGIWEEDVDWLAWWTTYYDAVALYRRPGLDFTRWHVLPEIDIDGTGKLILFTLCGDTMVFARTIAVKQKGDWRYRVEWNLWAYRSPDCTSEDLSNDWMLRNC